MQSTSRSIAVLGTLVLATLVAFSSCSTPRTTKTTAAAEPGAPVDWNVKPPPKKVTGHPMRVKYLDFVSGHVFELVNESHSNPLDVYSKKVPKAQAYTKVQTDEVVQALMDRFDEQGVKKHLQPGLAPFYPAGTRAGALEIEGEKGPSYWLILDKSPQAERTAFQTSAKDFVALYNATESWQAVEGAPEWQDAANESARRQPSKFLDSRKLPDSGKKP